MVLVIHQDIHDSSNHPHNNNNNRMQTPSRQQQQRSSSASINSRGPFTPYNDNTETKRSSGKRKASAIYNDGKENPASFRQSLRDSMKKKKKQPPPKTATETTTTSDIDTKTPASSRAVSSSIIKTPYQQQQPQSKKKSVQWKSPTVFPVYNDHGVSSQQSSSLANTTPTRTTTTTRVGTPAAHKEARHDDVDTTVLLQTPPPSSSSLLRHQASSFSTPTTAPTPLSTTLRRSMLGLEQSTQPQTPTTTLLQRELLATSMDVSLLISPTTNNSILGAPIVQEEEEEENDVNTTTLITDVMNMTPLLEEDFTAANDDHDENLATPSISTTPAHEASPLTENTNQALLQVVQTNNNTVEDKQTGGGIEMDLSHMFSELQSPPPKQSLVETIPTLLTNDFRQGLSLDFGTTTTNVVGESRSLAFLLKTGTNTGTSLQIESIPYSDGIQLVVDNPSQAIAATSKTAAAASPNVLKVPFKTPLLLWVTWTPVESGTLRAAIFLKNGPGRLRITMQGQAREAETTTKKRLRFAAKTPAKGSTALTPARQRHATHATPGNPKTTRTMSTTPARASVPDDWAEQQCLAFTEWLNYMFHPEADITETTSGALRTLLHHQRLAQARTKALQVFQTPKMNRVRQALVAEIAKGRLSLRKDRDLHADLTLRQKVLSLLLSYSTQWLRIGLEVLFGQAILCDTTTHSVPTPKKRSKKQLSRMKLTLKKFIIDRVLSDADTLRKYTKGKCNVPSGSFEKKYRAEMRTLILTRLLVLIVFMDQAKTCNILDRVPKLFENDSRVKSTRDVLVSFCRDFLSAEGDIVKHLSRIGIKVCYKQEPIDELNFTVVNLATDIRDGVRLARMAEILSSATPKSILATLRLPAVSRLQKLHNVGAVLDRLKLMGVSSVSEIAAHHIVDGYREQVLKLLWSVVAQCGLDVVLDKAAVKVEITKVLASNRTRRVRWALLQQRDFNNGGIVVSEPQDTTKTLLLRWCDAVVEPFGLQVNDCTSSFADGVALCIMIHYYHPALLPLDEILPTSRHGITGKEADDNEQHNRAMATECMSELGGIPKILPSGPPEERTMLLCLAYLCSRLMQSSSEVLAAIAIQLWYRREKRVQLLQQKVEASKIIFDAWLSHKDTYYANQHARYFQSVITLERFIWNHKSQLVIMRKHRMLVEDRVRCATLIQSHYRRWKTENRVLPLLLQEVSAREIQQWWRLWRSRNVFRSIVQKQHATTVIQTAWRRFIATRSYYDVQRGVCAFQAMIRGAMLRQSSRRMIRAATLIQKIWRSFMCQVLYQVDRLDIITAQSVVRRKLAIQHYMRVSGRKEAAVLIQTFVRVYQSKRFLERQVTRRDAAILLQRFGRGYVARSDYLHLQQSVVIMQSFSRMIICRTRFLEQMTGIIKLQSGWRAHVQRDLFRFQIKAVMLIQSMVRMRIAKCQSVNRQNALLVIQTSWRRRMAYQEVEVLRMQREALERAMLEQKSVVLLQSSFRRVICIEKAKHLRLEKEQLQRLREQSSVSVQCWIRQHFAQRKLRRLQKANDERARAACAVLIQSHVRKFLACLEARRRLAVIHQAAIVIQSNWRSLSALDKFFKAIQATVIMQSLFRGAIVRRTVTHQHKSAVVIQSVWRKRVAVKRFKAVVLGVTALQSIYRGQAAALIAVRRIVAIVTIQGAVRGYLARNILAQRHQAATVLQSCWRMSIAAKHFKMLVCGVTALQSAYRGQTGALVALHRYMTIVSIQAAARGRLSRNALARMNQAATVLQSCWRMHLAAKRYKTVVVGVTALQSIYRGQTGAVIALHRYMTIVSIQAAARGRLSRNALARKHQAATVLQCCWRMHTMAKRFKTMVVGVTALQSVYRGQTGALIALHRYMAIVSIQAAMRRCCVCAEMARRQQAATTVQREWKCFVAVVEYQCTLFDIVLVQSLVRRWNASRYAAIKLDALKTLQGFARNWVSRRRAAEWRRAMIAERHRFDQAATIVQTMIRGFQARKLREKHHACIQIQKTWRCFSVHVDYMLAILDIMTIQRCAREFIHRKRVERAIPAIVCLQSRHRCHIVRREFLIMLGASILIQAHYRSHLARRRLCLEHEAITSIQKYVRGFLARVSMEIEMFAATEIQRTWRGFMDRVEALYLLVMVVRIQRCARQYVAIRRVQRCREECAAVKIQRLLRGHLDRCRIGFMLSGVVRLQAHVRGNCIRSKRKRKILVIAKRVMTANTRAEQNPRLRLGERTRVSLKELQTSKRLTEIMEAAKVLETSTRLSRNCCIAFAKADAPSILYDLIGSCNRSLPHIEILHYVLLALKNVANHNDLLVSVATPQSVEIFLDLVQMFRDKNAIFSVAIALLLSVVRSDWRLQQACSKAEHMKRLSHVLKKVSGSVLSRDSLDVGNTRSRSREGENQRKQGIKKLRILIKLLENPAL